MSNGSWKQMNAESEPLAMMGRCRDCKHWENGMYCVRSGKDERDSAWTYDGNGEKFGINCGPAFGAEFLDGF